MTIDKLEQIRTIALEVNSLNTSLQNADSSDTEAICVARKALTEKVVEQERLRVEFDGWFDSLLRYQKTPVLLYYFLGHTKAEVLSFTGLCDSSWRRINQAVKLSLKSAEV